MNKKNSGFNKASVVIGLICALVISALFLNMSIFTPITEEQVMKE